MKQNFTETLRIKFSTLLFTFIILAFYAGDIRDNGEPKVDNLHELGGEEGGEVKQNFGFSTSDESSVTGKTKVFH